MSAPTYGDERLSQRFWSKVYPEPNTGCWLWGAATTTAGYGSYWLIDIRKVDYAHRVSYSALVGKIPAGLEIDHLCRVRGCVNPAHLEVVTHSVNMKRSESWYFIAAINRDKPHCLRGHPLSGDNLYLAPGSAERHCRACRLERERASRRARGCGVANYLRTHCPQGHPYDEENTYVRPNGSRQCRTCQRAWDRRRRAA